MTAGTPGNGRKAGEPGSAGIAVREPVPEDAPEMAVLSAVLGYPIAAATLAENLARLAGKADQRILVATSAGTVVGWIHAQIRDTLESGIRAEIAALVVSDRARRQGIGRRLVLRAEAWARDQGLRLIVVRSNAARTESHKFYPALGYSRAKTSVVYHKPLNP